MTRRNKVTTRSVGGAAKCVCQKLGERAASIRTGVTALNATACKVGAISTAVGFAGVAATWSWAARDRLQAFACTVCWPSAFVDDATAERAQQLWDCV